VYFFPKLPVPPVMSIFLPLNTLCPLEVDTWYKAILIPMKFYLLYDLEYLL
jgi:hypothetical protein